MKYIELTYQHQMISSPTMPRHLNAGQTKLVPAESYGIEPFMFGRSMQTPVRVLRTVGVAQRIVAINEKGVMSIFFEDRRGRRFERPCPPEQCYSAIPHVFSEAYYVRKRDENISAGY